MAQYKDSVDGLDRLIGLRPSIQEQVQRSAHTEVEIPVQQARAMTWIKARRAAFWPIAVLVSVGMAVAFGHDLLWAGFGLLGLLALGGLVFGIWSMSRKEADELLLKRFRTEIPDPNRDSELHHMLEMVLDRLPDQGSVGEWVIKAEVQNGGGQWRFARIPAPSPRQLQALARALVDSQMPRSLSVRTGEEYGFTRERYYGPFLDTLTAQGWAVARDPDAPTLGVELTAAGREVMREIATSPLPSNGV